MLSSLPTALDTTHLKDLLDNLPRTRLIDVRTPGEFAAARIPGSANVPLDLLRENTAHLDVVHEDPLVLVCASGARSEQARSVLVAAFSGRTPKPLTVLHGGITAWEQSGGTLTRGTGGWAMERQVRLAAGLLVLCGIGLSTLYEPLKWIAGFVGTGLTVAALTNTCAMSRLLERLPHNRTRKTDAPTLLSALTEQHPQRKNTAV